MDKSMLKIFKFYRYSMENFYKFDGRASRMEVISFFVVYMLTLFTASVITLIYSNFLNGNADRFLLLWLITAGITVLIHIIPYISLCTRRLHDINVSGWLQLIAYFVPMGSLILFIICSVVEGNTTRNDYGPKPGYY